MQIKFVRKTKAYILASCAALLLLLGVCVAGLLLQAGVQQRALQQQQQNFQTAQTLGLALSSADCLLAHAGSQKPAYYYYSPQHPGMALLGWYPQADPQTSFANETWLDYCAFSRHHHPADSPFSSGDSATSPRNSAAGVLQQCFGIEAYAEWRHSAAGPNRQLRYCWFIEDQQAKYNLLELGQDPQHLQGLLAEPLQLSGKSVQQLCRLLQQQGALPGWSKLEELLGRDTLQRLQQLANWSYAPYELQQFIPAGPMLAKSCRHQQKLSLGELLELPDTHLQQKILCEHLALCLPQFALRGGAMPAETYLQNISANLLDLLDKDQIPRCSKHYRGLEELPFISELFINYRWQSTFQEAKNTYALLEIDIYTELHQWADCPFEGQLSFGVQLPWKYTSEVRSGKIDDSALLAPSSRQNIREQDGLWWSPPANFALQAGEYKVYKIMQLQLRLPLAKAGQKTPDKLELNLQKNRYIGYALAYAGQIYDTAGKGAFQSEIVLHYPPNKSRKNQSMRCNESAHSLGTYGKLLGVSGDERISFYLQDVQASNQWPDNASPFRRNVRRKLFNAAAIPPSYSYVNISCWPDGGLDSPSTQQRLSKEAELLEPLHAFWQKNASRQSYRERIKPAAYLEELLPLWQCYDPLLWNPHGTDEGNITLHSTHDRAGGGGNTLRIARREHPRFEHTAQQAALLLDVLNPYLQQGERGADWRQMRSQINLNSCSPQVLLTLLQHAFALSKKSRQRLLRGQFKHWNKAEATRLDEPSGKAAHNEDEQLRQLAATIMQKRPVRGLGELAELLGGYDPRQSGQMAFAHYHEHRLEKLLATSCLHADNYRIYAVAELLDAKGRLLKRFAHTKECSRSRTGEP